jgi:predicted aspartyl protease
MKRSVSGSLYPWLLALALPFSSAAQQDPAAGSSLPSLEVPFQLYNGYLIVVEGRIGELTGLKFILDTGVTTSVLDSKIAAKLKLSGRPNHVVNFGKTVPVESSTIPEVQFGPVQARNVEMFIASLNKLSDFARGADALIGVDLLQLNNLTFDYDRRRVLFSPIDHNIQGTQMRPEPTCFTVRVQVQGHPIHLLLDTGLEGVLLYEDRIRAHIPGLRMEPGAKKVTIGRRMNAKLVTLPEMRLGPTVMDGRVLLMEGPPGKTLEGIDGYIGIAPFHPARIAFDFASKTLRWD